ncbi:MAG TPA: hypothetical protein VL383_04510 [Gemmatimonadaceae bacterium]|nr:hypothetical protein [Gemmatimonadaceae bacterium]
MSARAIGLVAPWLISIAADRVAAQATIDTTRCDSIVAAARADSVDAGLFVSTSRVAGAELSPARVDKIVSAIATAFEPPRPFRLTVFSGDVRMRTLRPRARSRAQLRAPVLRGIYRVYTSRKGVDRVALVRSALMPGFDSAAIEAIRWGGEVGVFMPSRGEDSLALDITFSSDSAAGARRIVRAFFPRMPVVDALPALDNPAPDFPDDERADSTTYGEVVFRLVVDRAGAPMMETVEVLRAASVSFVRAAVKALPMQRFVPATIHGCAVAQEVEYPMTFVLPRAPSREMQDPGDALPPPALTP